MFRLRLNIGFFGGFGMVNGCEPAGWGSGWGGGWGSGRGNAGCGVWVFGGFVVGKFFVVDGTVLLVEILPGLSWKLDL